MITSKQRAYLRGLANDIPAIMQVGKGGLSENLTKTFPMRWRRANWSNLPCWRTAARRRTRLRTHWLRRWVPMWLR